MTQTVTQTVTQPATQPATVLPLMSPPQALHDASRLQRVVEAHRVVTADLSLLGLLDRLLLAAVTLTAAEFGAVVVLSSSGSVARTTVHEVAAAERAQWRAVLDPLVDPATAAPPHERARRVRSGHLVGAQVRVRDVPFVEVYVGASRRALLDDDAELLLQSLAELAGGAVENALLHEEARRSKDWLQASGEIARTLLSDAETDADTDMLMQVVVRALHVAEADSAGLLLPDGDGRLRVAVASGRGADDFRGAVIDAGSSALGRAVLRGESLLVDDMAEIMRADYVNVHEFGPVMATPLADALGVRGSVVLCRRRGRLSFSARDLDLATVFADQLALALEMDDARLRGEWVKVLEDRHRIAQDLHDNVMQRLFATGVGLQSLAGSTLPPDIGRRLGRYIADLDETIEEIRTRVFGLRDADGVRREPVTSRFPRVAPAETATAHTRLT